MPIDFANIVASLAGINNAAAASNPYAGLGNFADSFGQGVVQGAGQHADDPTSTIIAGLVAGLAGGAFKGLGDNYQNNQKQMSNALVGEMLRGNTPSVLAKPEGMDDSVFNAVQGLQTAKQYDDATTAGLAQAARKAKIEDTIISGVVENPYRKDKILSALDSLNQRPSGPATLKATEQPSTLLAPSESQTAAPAGPKTYEQYLEQFDGVESAANAAMAADREKPYKQADQLGSLRKEFSGLQEIKVFETADTGWKSMQKAFLDPTGTSDIELTRGGIQAIEPGLAVRTDDQQAIENSPSLSASMKAQMLGALNGTSKLSPDVRQGLMRIAARRYLEHANKFNAARSSYNGIATRQGLFASPEDSITYLGEATLPTDDQLYMGIDQKPAPPPVPPGMKLQQNPKTGEYRLKPL